MSMFGSDYKKSLEILLKMYLRKVCIGPKPTNFDRRDVVKLHIINTDKSHLSNTINFHKKLSFIFAQVTILHELLEAVDAFFLNHFGNAASGPPESSY